MSLNGEPGSDPLRVGLPIADILAEMFGAYDVLAAVENRTADEAIALLQEAGVPAGHIRVVGEVYASPQVQHLGLIERMTHPTLGEVRVPGTPPR